MQISVSATRKPSNPPHPNPERTKRRPDPVLKFRGLAASGSQHFRWSPSRRLRKQYTHHAPTATPPPTPTPPPKNPATTTQNTPPHPQTTGPASQVKAVWCVTAELPGASGRWNAWRRSRRNGLEEYAPKRAAERGVRRRTFNMARTLNARRAGNHTVAGPSQATGFRCTELPGRLRDARELTTVSHVAEANTGDAELLEGTARTAIDDVAVTQTYR